MPTLIDARSFAPESREESLRSALQELFELDIRIEHDLPAGLYTRILRHDFGTIHISEIEGHAHCSEVTPSAPTDPRHDTVNAWIALQGSGWLLQDAQRVPIAPGVLSICSGAKVRAITRASSFRNVLVRIPRRELLPHLCGRHVSLPYSVDATRGPGALFCDAIVSLIAHCLDVGADARPALIDVLLRLLASVLLYAPENQQSPTTPEPWHKARIREFVAQHLRDRGLSVDTISRGVGLSPRYLHQLYASEPQPLMHWIWSMRLDRARDDLRDSAGRTIGDIAATWGFVDAAHFSRAFKKRFGETPAEARRRLARE
ncbi:MAG TPA: helix-turn-helix domain-containing protein [Burkholderiales bacterium]|nr:helix-turn-helix domain-containing protein [Burkholderiales bacterium]